MNKIILSTYLAFLSVNAFAAELNLNSVSYVYEIGESNTFDFSSGPTHECGTNLYRVSSPSADSVNRKFSLVLSAFMADKKLIVNTEVCTGNRMKVSWIRLTN